ncbi:MAG: hypothetical protein CVU06_13950 [Bacteroidetes bacterium HGW-Bacteroidetes-22]|nr:MAG: hypothetical protein CVU06_13950 [Bacteroidetes bacterium HGW-Bacteroidetes-22]
MKDQISKNEKNPEVWEKVNNELTIAMQRLAEEEMTNKKALKEIQQQNELIAGFTASNQQNQELIAGLKKSKEELTKKMKEIETELSRKNKLERELKKLLSGGE